MFVEEFTLARYTIAIKIYAWGIHLECKRTTNTYCTMLYSYVKIFIVGPRLSTPVPVPPPSDEIERDDSIPEEIITPPPPLKLRKWPSEETISTLSVITAYTYIFEYT